MATATYVPRIDVLIPLVREYVFLEPKKPTAAELRANPGAETTYTSTATIYYEQEHDRWVMLPRDSKYPDGTKKGMILFIWRPIVPETTHIRIMSITQNGRGARGVPFTLGASSKARGKDPK